MNATADGLILPPHSIEAEQAVLGGILIGGTAALDRIEGMLAASDFYRNEHREIFAAICSLSNRGSAIDVITVAEALAGSGIDERTGGLAYLATLSENTPSAANIRRYAEIVKERAQQRGLMALAQGIMSECAAPGAKVDEIIAQADAAMVQLLDTGAGDEPTMLVNAMGEAIDDIDDRQSGHRRSGLQTGIAELDALTCGLEPGQLIIVAARPSVGKTALGLNIADHAVRGGDPVSFFSLEMTKRELSQRLLALRARVSVAAMRSGALEQDQWDRIFKCRADADGQPLFLIDRSGVGVPYIRAAARRIKRQHGLGLVIVDYLGLMKGEGQNRTQEIGSISRGLKSLAKELHVPIIALAQLNRATEGRMDKRPMLSDLRDSGEIEQDADIVAMLHREENYSSASEWKGVAELLIRKNRNGPLGTVYLDYRSEFMRFSDSNRTVPQHQVSPAQRGGFQ